MCGCLWHVQTPLACEDSGTSAPLRGDEEGGLFACTVAGVGKVGGDLLDREAGLAGEMGFLVVVGTVAVGFEPRLEERAGGGGKVFAFLDVAGERSLEECRVQGIHGSFGLIDKVCKGTGADAEDADVPGLDGFELGRDFNGRGTRDTLVHPDKSSQCAAALGVNGLDTLVVACFGCVKGHGGSIIDPRCLDHSLPRRCPLLALHRFFKRLQRLHQVEGIHRSSRWGR